MNGELTMRQIFVSYAQYDEEFAVRLVQDLRTSGARVWLDILDAEPGRHWTRSIERALSESQMMIVVLSPESLQSAHVAVEWQAYLEARRPVIPVVARPCNLPGPLRTRRPVDFTADYWRAFHQLSLRLIEYGTRSYRSDPVIWAINTEIQDRREEQSPPPPPEAELENPSDSGLRRMVSALRDLLRPHAQV